MPSTVRRPAPSTPAYFLAGQAHGTTIYFENLNNQFISLARPLAGRPIVDLDFLLNDVAIRTKPLDAIRVLSSPAPLTVMATDVTSATRALLVDGGRWCCSAPCAGATMPVVAGRR